MSLREEMWKYEQITGENAEHVPIIKLGAFLDGYEMGLKALEQKWIPVSERLPENYGEYICTMSNDNVQECGFVPSGEKGLIPGWSTCEADGFKKLDYRDIIAWMPLPEPYKEDGK